MLLILGFTWDKIRMVGIKVIGETVVKALETGFELVSILRNEGISGLWEHIKEQFSDLKETVMDAITGMIQSQVVQAGIKWIMGLLTPAGAFVKAAMAIIDIVKFFVQRASQIMELVQAFIEGVKAVASGSVKAVASTIENALVKAIPVVIGFLASLLGLGGLTQKVIGIFKKIHERVEKGLITLWTKIKTLGKSILGKITGKDKGKDKEKTESENKNDQSISPKKFSIGSETHTLSFENGHLMMASAKERLDFKLKNFRTQDNDQKIKLLLNQTEHFEKLAIKLKDKSIADAIKVNIKEEADILESSIIVTLKEIFYGTDGDIKKEMKKTQVSFSKTKGDVKEYIRQLKMQENEINIMQIGNWQHARIKFIRFGRDEADTKVQRREAFLTILLKHPVDAVLELNKQNLLEMEDEKFVNTILLASITENEKKMRLTAFSNLILKRYGSKKLAVLHSLDQIAGGLATKYGDEITIFGDSAINSDIGNQWDKGNVKLIDEGTKGVDPVAKMNVELN